MRLTKKIKTGYAMIHKSMGSQSLLDMHQEKMEITEVVNKLGQLEDILEKYNVDIYDMQWIFKYAEESKEFNTKNKEKLEFIAKLEDELGIDLIVLLKAVKNGVWCKHSYSIDYEPFRIDYCIDYETNEREMFICGMKIKNYGKTWALTKEELE